MKLFLKLFLFYYGNIVVKRFVGEYFNFNGYRWEDMLVVVFNYNYY